jgi:hypothetical protein
MRSPEEKKAYDTAHYRRNRERILRQRKGYRHSPAGKEAAKRYENKYRKKYRQSPKGRKVQCASTKRYRQTIKGKATTFRANHREKGKKRCQLHWYKRYWQHKLGLNLANELMPILLECRVIKQELRGKV